MKITSHAIVLLAFTILFGACATEQKVTKTQVKTDWRGRTVPFTVGKDKDGNPVMKSDRRSPMEGRQSNIAGGRDFGGKDYSKKSYGTKRWFGNTIFGKKEYQGNTDARRYQREPWFVKKQAQASSKRAYAKGKSYTVNPFSTSAARESGGRQLARTVDAETNVRRRVYKQPDIIDWKNQQGLSINDTNKMLGR